ncbi:CGNR zinc finger domain-containing protein [Cellulomonas endophytica]|uniref:CGNR zinc finger domain-containing protein n=1 Tax=Cellulomonas endophytica TaxID=2494735 RepID=UPI00101340E8|nr:CGNR zinc finger domain-containing protein [Cellulomonas endophytica]
MAGALAAWVSEGEEPGVAPAPLEAVRALLNTDDRFHGVDHLAGGPPPLVAVRDALRAYLTGGGSGALDALAAAHPLVVRFGGDEHGAATTRLGPARVPGDEAGDAAAAVTSGTGDTAAAVAEALAVVHVAHADGTWRRLKTCGNPGCRWVFYDASRNRSGRWCAMGECGDVMKARAYRERRRHVGADEG